MRSFLRTAAGCAALLILSACDGEAPGPGARPPLRQTAAPAAIPGPINPVVTNCNITPPPSPPVVTPAIAMSGLPCSLAFNGKFALEPLQEAFDFNSWLTFLALSAPGQAAPAGADAPTKWEGWQDLFSLMLPDGSPPPAFGTSLPPPAICREGGRGTRVLRMISKTPVTPTLSVAGQPLNTGPLIDQNGHYVRYQILVNQPMYDYIVANGLYSKAGQAKFTGDIAFPIGDTTEGTTGTIGAIVVKAAWKVLDPSDPNDGAGNFHVTRSFVYTPPAPGVAESCKVETLGLVGLHIVHKTRTEPQWIWSTFEHSGNAPDGANGGKLPSDGHFNFFRPGCSAAACPQNKAPPQPWDPSKDPFPGGFHSQIVRKTSYPPIARRSAALWNTQFQSAIKGSVWANYQLITTQWPTDGTNRIDPNGVPFPVFAANTTMETYVQGNVPQASSSCMACHGNATGTGGRTSDFSFVLEKAN
jgi:hypothetical protein